MAYKIATNEQAVAQNIVEFLTELYQIHNYSG